MPRKSHEDDDIDTCPDNISLNILKYGAQTPLELPTISLPKIATDVDVNSDKVNGSWAGFFLRDVNGKPVPYRGLFRISFSDKKDENGSFTGSAATYTGDLGLQYILDQSESQTTRKVDFIISAA
ncbi:hypothetical protein C0991_010866, partial [Blastosporella zonata]